MTRSAASPTPGSAPAVDLEALRFAYERKGPDVIDIPRFTAAAGERVFLKGASGSGKSTLLGLIAGILDARSGAVRVLGEDLSALSAARRDRFRAERLGVIFQMFNLLPWLPVGANIVLPGRFSPARRAGGLEAEGRRLLTRLGLDPQAVWDRPARALSVGQQQRVAAARALIGRPGLILADEPTSALDADSRDAFIALLMEECAASGAALIFVSHDGALARHFDRAEDLAVLNRAGLAEAAS
ncbi:ATP-binding cassette domain-containing protein [Alkalicaulis satelles]|uniref:ATP-binding cassette domain-containing protein n=1 Tax=Alkalicaulis satelles TaxID=2609175 RepID=A0A5M6ZG78_9PROT|nr:ATP-binding cassette domain-containing protein [Alkalicaulis satelles]KAA5803762.1 ATP-binding cassette domain-containing protein [Alkalicaulis satelles]